MEKHGEAGQGELWGEADEPRPPRWPQSLRAAEEELLDLLFDLCCSCILIVDRSAAIQVANPASLRLLGYAEAKLRGRCLLDLAADARDRRRLGDLVARLHGAEVRSVELRLRRAHGAVVRLGLTAHRIGGGANPDSIVLVGDPSPAAATPFESPRGDSDLIRRVLLGSADPTFVLNARTRVVLDCNTAAATLFQWRREDLIGQTLLKLFPDRESYLRMGLRLVDLDAAAGIFQDELRLKTRLGEAVPCRMTSICFSGAETRVVLVRECAASSVRDGVLERLARRAAELSEELSALAPPGSGQVAQSRSRSVLSLRQAEIMREVTRGATSKEIARSLGISESTVKNHLAVMYRKFGATSRLQLIDNLKRRYKLML